MESPQSNAYTIAFERATSPETREDFWREEAKSVEWYKFPTKILDSSKPPFYYWFPDGEINICYNTIDRHIRNSKKLSQRAVIWVSNMVQKERIYTWKELYENVCKMAKLLRQQGVQKGDRVIVFMPMIPEALFVVMAIVRLGAIHSIVFGGFAARQLANRITDSTPKVMVTVNYGLQPHKIINYVEIMSEAMDICGLAPKVLIFERPDKEITIPNDWQKFDIDKLQFEHVDCTIVKSTDPLYILYTSGTTGSPKGIVRDQGGTAVALEWTMNHIMGINDGDVYFSASDIGWVVGHSFLLYGPLLRGATTLIYEGKPNLPNPGTYWAIMEKYKVNGFYTNPTALRAIRKEDKDGQWFKKYDTSSLRGVSMAGQRCDVPTYEWIRDNLKVLINDNYWQTEAGWIISCNYMNLYTFEPKPGSATKPCPGFDVQVLDTDNKVLQRKSLGKVCIKLPMPPSFMLTLYNNDKAFLEKYMEETPGYYTTGDAGYFDQDGYLNIMTRLDDIINTAGHRLSTASMEEVLIAGGKVVEAAVVAKIEQLKGEVPIGFVVLKEGVDASGVHKQLVSLIRKEIGPVAAFQHVLVVDKLPKTRSGKILRHVLRKIVEAEPYKIPPTIEDDSVLPVIEEVVRKYGKGLGEKKKLIYVNDLDNELVNEVNEFQDEIGEIIAEGNLSPSKRHKTQDE